MMYLRMGFIVIFLGVVVMALWFRGEAIQATAQRDQARAEVQIAADANKAAVETIGRLRAEDEANDRLMEAMAAELTAINDQITAANAALHDLRESDENRSYLDTPVPPGVDGVLNH